MTDEAQVLVEHRGRVGVLTLNRPRAINALTHEMVRIIQGALAEWRTDDSVTTVLIQGAGDRGLCAGGDIVSLHADATTGDGAASARFWADEYAMNNTIATYPKPIVAVQDGFVLGGGVGVSAHASHRIVTERTRIGFPETAIGFVPDVGATWLLSRSPRALGLRLGLSSENVGAADAIAVGFADAYVPSDALAALIAALEERDADTAVAAVAETPPAGRLEAQRTWSDEAFAAGSVVELLDRLRATGNAEAEALADAIDGKSPVALAVTWESLTRAIELSSLAEALAQEYRVSLHALMTADFVEGVRAQVIDKDRNPVWSPASHAMVTREQIDAYFAPSLHGELTLSKNSVKETT